MTQSVHSSLYNNLKQAPCGECKVHHTNVIEKLYMRYLIMDLRDSNLSCITALTDASPVISRCMHCESKVQITVMSNSEYSIRRADGSTECDAHKLNWNFKLEVPSGKLLIANNLTRAVKKGISGEDEYSLSSVAGMHKYTSAYASVNMMYAYSGNTSPRVFQDNNTLYFGHYDEDETDSLIYATQAKEIGCVCTDLWAVTAMDYDLLLSTAAKNFALGSLVYHLKIYDHIIVDVDPGTYTFVPHYEAYIDDNDSFNSYTSPMITITKD